MFSSFAEDCRKIRLSSPLIHNITNYVAMEMSANALLAVGASPVMSSEKEEMEDIAVACNTLVINIGCLEKNQITAMKIAASEMNSLGKPWVLDPVGAGLSRLRTDTAMDLIYRYSPSVIRGNASEVMSLAGVRASRRGVDSVEDSSSAVMHAVELARKYHTVVSVSGQVDYITDGRQIVSIGNGSPLMPSVTAMGCTASALTAAFLAVDGNALRAASYAMAMMGVAGEIAASGCGGPGSLAVRFIDALYSISGEELVEHIRYGQKEA